ncbi:hypothetical protein BKA70DRAFT_1568158 [Coprinopsis sp. MPI-PUGE-AT-0042]|nr:hypothetical protein BKA70DRAFT_1568158 [Coprinopsis sp. MPI-PUGE-AT-0042]
MDGPAESPIVGWQPSAASAIFDSPNILRTICTSLATRKDVLNMALLCKAANPVVLDEIWRSRRSMAQLLAPLYCDGFISTLTPKLVLCRNLTSQDSTWTRFRDHASRIRVLTVGERFFETTHHGTMLQLMQLVGSRPMFPHLLNLVISGEEEGAVVSYLPLFISPTLSLVSIQIDSGESEARISAHLVELFLALTQEKGVPLENFSIVAKIPVSTSSFLSTLSRSNTLRVLNLEGVQSLDTDETDWVTNLGLLEGLEELKIVAEEDRSGRVPLQAFIPPDPSNETVANETSESPPEAHMILGPPEPKTVPRYPRLKKLCLQAPARVVDAVLSCVASKVLDDLTLKPQATSAVNDIIELYACLDILSARDILHGILKHFTFEANVKVPGRYYWSSSDRDPLIQSSRFAVIAKLSRLRYLEVRNRLDDTEEFFRSVVALLPCLVECRIPLSSESADITIFPTLASSCPELVHLQLPIRTEFPPFKPMLFTPKKHRLQHLTLSDWSDHHYNESQVFLAVRHLNASFPFLRVLEGGSNWEKVLTVLGTVQDIARSG